MTEKDPPLDQLNRLIALSKEGKHEEVEFETRVLVGQFPASGFAWMILGVSLQAQEKGSLFALQRAVQLLPGDAEAHCNLGVTFEHIGRLKEAETSYRLALELNPKYVNAHISLGNLLRAQGLLDLAQASYQIALEISPQEPEVHISLGCLYKDLKRFDLSEESFRIALRLQPGNAKAYNFLGNLSLEQGQFEEASTHFSKAVSLNPTNASYYYNLGLSKQHFGHMNEAMDCFRLSIQIEPNFGLAHYQIGAILHQLGRLDEAVVEHRLAIKLLSGARGSLNKGLDAYVDHGYIELFTILMQQKKYIDAKELCIQVIEIRPDFAEMHQNLAVILAYLSDYQDVVEESNFAFEIKPNNPVMWEQRLYTFSYHPDLSTDEIFKEFVRWGDQFPEPEINLSGHDRNPTRRLRIGYVSPDFRIHTSRFFFWPLFSNHDQNNFELFAYSNVATEDAWTQIFKGPFAHWRDIRGVDDEAVATLIKEDRIDILVDLCGHMLDDRLGVFALKPAPIQATWLGSAWTTGLKAIDYVLFDPFVAPEGTLARESVIRLPQSFMVFRPKEMEGDIRPAPCLKNGYVTFGYTGRTERLNHRTFKVWGEILKHLPEAKLILDFGPFAEPRTQVYYFELLAKHGLDTSRVTMRKSHNIFEGLNDIDILLDSFPHSGGTMLTDAFWMGVPAVTLASRPPVGRLGLGMLMNLNLPEWIAYTEAEYIEKACGFGGQPEALNTLRLGLRARLKNSPLMDGPAFAKGVEAAYRAMFEHWIQEDLPA